MIKTLRTENIYNVINAIPAITGLAEVFSRKPDVNATPNWAYVYFGVVSDNTQSYSNKGALANTARISFTIVCKKELGATDTEERVLYDIMDTITNAIVNEWCAKIPNWDDEFVMNSIIESTISPIFTNESNRAYIVKDYIFNYMSF